ncbi:MAG: Gfo/Idh/MocA family protein [Phycisphaerales bacterium]
MSNSSDHDNSAADRSTPPQGIDRSRRSFLASTAAMAGAAALLGSARPAKAERRVAPLVKAGRISPPGPDEPVRIAVIGVGGMGTGHCHAIMNLTKQGRCNAQIIGVADVNDLKSAHAKRVCEQEQGIEVTATRDYRDLIARPDVHGVLVATTEHWHAQHAIDALVAGKDVYCEKPMTLRLGPGMDLRDTVLKYPDRIFQVGTQMIMLPKYQEARALIGKGEIGPLVWSQTSYCRNSYDGEWNYYGLDDNWKPGENLDWDTWCGDLGPRAWDPLVYARWRRYKDFSTGIIGDLLVHVMTPLIYATNSGWPVRVVATGNHVVDKKMENHDQVNLTIVWEDGHTMVIAGSTANEVGLETLVRGHRANMYLGGRHCVLRPERIYADEMEPRQVDCPDIGNDQDQLRLNWIECVRSREPAASNVDLASKVMVAVDLATRSIWDGHAYRFDPETLRASRVG